MTTYETESAAETRPAIRSGRRQTVVIVLLGYLAAAGAVAAGLLLSN
jgi:hypothetical protein